MNVIWKHRSIGYALVIFVYSPINRPEEIAALNPQAPAPAPATASAASSSTPNSERKALLPPNAKPAEQPQPVNDEVRFARISIGWWMQGNVGYLVLIMHDGHPKLWISLCSRCHVMFWRFLNRIFGVSFLSFMYSSLSNRPIVILLPFLAY